MAVTTPMAEFGSPPVGGNLLQSKRRYDISSLSAQRRTSLTPGNPSYLFTYYAKLFAYNRGQFVHRKVKLTSWMERRFHFICTYLTLGLRSRYIYQHGESGINIAARSSSTVGMGLCDVPQ